MNWCILIPALVGLLCGILGYLLGRLFGGGSNNIDEWKNKNAKLQADLDACKGKLSAKGTSGAGKTAAVASSLAATSKASSSSSFNAAAAKAAYGKKVKQNDLTVVEGIGPKIQELFHNHDVKTWRSLSECSQATCQKVLDSGGKRYQMHDPGSWPKQAGMAADGKWAELAKWQESHKGGKL